MAKIAAMMVTVVLVMTAAAEPVKLGPLAAEPPKGWVAEKPSNRLRSHQFKLKSGMEGVADAEVIVFPESKPDPEKVFPGWKSQFEPPEGKTIEDVSKVSKFEVSGATVYMLDISGTWNYKERPFDPKSKLEKREDYRAVWAIVVVKDEATHVRLSGPRVVVKGQYEDFISWLKAMK